MRAQRHRVVRGRHLPALDGLRALAVAGVVAYHLRLGWAGGGYLGVDLFFVLSGFLVTGLLLEEHEDTGRIALGAFWGRRARRLLPALVLLLGALALAARLGVLPAGLDVGALRADALATLADVANWHQLAAGQSYFAQFQVPSPLQHTWSLAIEEQFYLLWPLLVSGALWVLHRRRRDRGGPGWRRPLLVGTSMAAAASAVWMGLLAASGAGIDRLYYGTDTRAFDLLAGAALAVAVVARPAPSARARRALHVAGPVAAAGLAVVWAFAGGNGSAPRLMFEGGFALAAAAAVVVVADARLEEPGPLGRLLRLAPLRFVGRISYGLYLWHWPVITELTAARTGLSGPALDAACIATTCALAIASFFLVEQPLRRARLTGWSRSARAALAPVSMGLTAAIVVVALVPPSTAGAALRVRAGAAALSAGDVAGAGGLEHQVPIALPGGRHPTPAAPLRVLLLGDSVMRAQGPAVTAALRSSGAAVVTDHSFPGWGLSTDPGWAQELPGLLARTRPEVVVAMWSWDDQWLLRDPAGYHAVLLRFVRLLLHPGDGAPGAAGVLFEQYPPLVAQPLAPDGPAAQAQRVAGARAWSSLVATLPAAFPGRVQYLPVAPAVELHGRFATWLPPEGTPHASLRAWVRVRMVDDTHFCPAGAARYAAALAVDLHQLVDLPDPAPGWWSGAWSSDQAVYDTPAGSCPADHPG